MSLSEQIERVDGSQNSILKGLVRAFGVSADGKKIDEVAALAEASGMFSQLGGLTSYHVWRKTEIVGDKVPARYELGAKKDQLVFNGGHGMNGRGSVSYGTEIHIRDDGFLSLAGTTGSKTESFHDSTDFDFIKGKFVQFSEYSPNSFPESKLSDECKDKYFYIPESAKLTQPDGTTNMNEDNYGLRISGMQLVSSYPAVPPPIDITYPFSINRNAYQEGASGNTTIEYMGQLGDKARVVTGSYVGTGESGESNPNRVNLPSKARAFVIAFGKEGALTSFTSGGIWIEPADHIRPFYVSSSTYYGGKFAVSSDGVEWYASDASHQYNSEGYTYFYFAIL